MKVVLVIGSLRAGGAERVMAWLANSLAHQHEVTVLTMASPQEDFFATNSLVRRIAPTTIRGRIRGLAQFAWILFRLSRQSDVVVSFISELNQVTCALLWFTRTPVIVSERIEPIDSLGETSWRTTIRDLLYRRASAVVVQSSSLRERFEKVWSNCIHIPNPVPITEARGSGSSIGSENVVVVGSLTSRKDHATMLRAWALLSREFPCWTLTLVGDGPLRNELQAMSRELGICETVIFAGLSQDVGAWLDRSSLFVSTSRREGMSNALLEAMSHGLAWVVSDAPGEGARLAHMTGLDLVFETGDAHDLVRILRPLMASAANRQRVADKTSLVLREMRRKDPETMWRDLLESDSIRRSRS